MPNISPIKNNIEIDMNSRADNYKNKKFESVINEIHISERISPLLVSKL